MFHPGRFGKVGMNHFNKNKNEDHCPGINVDKLWSLIGNKIYQDAKKSTDKANVPVVDIAKFGYSKVLGRGRIPKIPFVVKAKFFSKKAEKKIKTAGGAVQLRA